MSEITKKPRKLRDGPVIMVDDQILRWRQKMAKQKIVLGTKGRACERKNARQNEERSKPEPTKRKWY